jgi:hypothetical protein
VIYYGSGGNETFRNQPYAGVSVIAGNGNGGGTAVAAAFKSGGGGLAPLFVDKIFGRTTVGTAAGGASRAASDRMSNTGRPVVRALAMEVLML